MGLQIAVKFCVPLPLITVKKSYNCLSLFNSVLGKCYLG